MVIEETLRLKVELDQSDLHTELANIRSTVATAVSPAAQSEAVQGSSPNNKDSIFWGLGSAAKHMASDTAEAAQFVTSAVQTGLQTGSQVTTALAGPPTPFSPGYVSPTGNTPIQYGMGQAISQSLSPFENRAVAHLSVAQNDAMAARYSEERFTGLRGRTLASEVGVGALSSVGWMIGGAVGKLAGGAVGGFAGMLAGGAVIDAIAAPGLNRLQDMNTLVQLGMTEKEAELTYGGGAWSAVKKNASNLFGLLDGSKDDFAAVFKDGMDINGQTYKGHALAGIMLDKGTGKMSGENLLSGELAMNELMTRTGMDITTAGSTIRSLSGYGTEGYREISSMLGFMAGSDSIGRNTRFQNQIMPSLMEAGFSGSRAGGWSAGTSELIDFQAAAMMLPAEDSDFAGMYSPDERVKRMGAGGETMSRSKVGESIMTRAAVLMASGNVIRDRSRLIGIRPAQEFPTVHDMSNKNITEEDARAAEVHLQGMGPQGFYRFDNARRAFKNMTPQGKLKMLMNSDPQKEGEDRSDYIQRIASTAQVPVSVAEDMVSVSDTRKNLEKDGGRRLNLRGGLHKLLDNNLLVDDDWRDVDEKLTAIGAKANAEGSTFVDKAKAAHEGLKLLLDFKEEAAGFMYGMGLNDRDANNLNERITRARNEGAVYSGGMSSKDQKDAGLKGLTGHAGFAESLDDLATSAKLAAQAAYAIADDNGGITYNDR